MSANQPAPAPLSSIEEDQNMIEPYDGSAEPQPEESGQGKRAGRGGRRNLIQNMVVARTSLLYATICAVVGGKSSDNTETDTAGPGPQPSSSKSMGEEKEEKETNHSNIEASLLEKNDKPKGRFKLKKMRLPKFCTRLRHRLRRGNKNKGIAQSRLHLLEPEESD